MKLHHVLIACLVGCGGSEPDKDSGPTTCDPLYADADGDGFGATGDPLPCDDTDGVVDSQDCDDGNAAVNPNSTETCNDVDDDCNGVVDDNADGAPTWHADSDDDGYGSDSSTMVACSPPAGHVASGGDCDDGSAAVNPGATETCNGIDDDCSGTPDDPELLPWTSWWPDDDGDGFGDGDVPPVEACAQPAGHTDDGTDCDDGDEDVNPASTEQCDDGIDNDCDATTHCGMSGAYTDEDASTRIDGESADGAGVAVLAADLDAAGGAELVVSSRAAGQGRVDIFLESPPGTYTPADADGGITNAAATPDELGAALVALDANGDGILDLAASAPGADAQTGAVLLAYGPVDEHLTDEDLPAITGVIPAARTGTSLASLDVQGDGTDELLVGSMADTAWIMTATGKGSMADASTAMHGEASDNGSTGTVVAAADLDGDGVDDAIVTAPAADGGGAVYLFVAPASGDLTTADGAAIHGDTGALGGAVAAGDLDGDGHTDLAVADRLAGAVYVFGSPVGAGSVADAAGRFVGSPADALGAATALGDVDGDGRADLFVSAPQASTAPIAWVYGPLAGVVDDSTADGTLSGPESLVDLGASLAVADTDRDGIGDLIGGAPAGEGGAGVVLILLGGRQ